MTAGACSHRHHVNTTFLMWQVPREHRSLHPAQQRGSAPPTSPFGAHFCTLCSWAKTSEPCTSIHTFPHGRLYLFRLTRCQVEHRTVSGEVLVTPNFLPLDRPVRIGVTSGASAWRRSPS